MSTELHDRLRRLLGTSIRAGLDVRPSRETLLPIEALVEGRMVDGARGSVFVGERGFDLGHTHGGELLGAFLSISNLAFGCLARMATVPELDPRNVLFLDTETTGLAGGTGTYVFLVGVAYFAGEQLTIQQYFMRDHAEEPAMLAALGETLARFKIVATFNGKAFDVPLLNTRHVATRSDFRFVPDYHLDLLFPSRRVWRDRLESCSLGAIEQHVLQHWRHDDLPSWAIPDAYFRYLRGGDARDMARVFEHNLHDLLSLIAVTSRLGRLFGAPQGDEWTADDRLAAARLYEDLGHIELAAATYERALAELDGSPRWAPAALRAAYVQKRLGRLGRSIELWRRVSRSGFGGIYPLVELAKFYEHSARDLDRAIAAVEHALTVGELRALRGGVAEFDRAELEYRLARLHRKRAARMTSSA